MDDDLSLLPSRRVPAGEIRCPDELIRALRTTLDVDVLWSVDEGTFLVLERDSSKRVDVNGQRVDGWRIALRYKDWGTKENHPLRFPDGRTIVDYVRERDTGRFGDTEGEKFRRFIESGDRTNEDEAFDSAERRAERLDGLSTIARMTDSTKRRWARRYMADQRKRIAQEVQHCEALGIGGYYE